MSENSLANFKMTRCPVLFFEMLSLCNKDGLSKLAEVVNRVTSEGFETNGGPEWINDPMRLMFLGMMHHLKGNTLALKSPLLANWVNMAGKVCSVVDMVYYEQVNAAKIITMCGGLGDEWNDYAAPWKHLAELVKLMPRTDEIEMAIVSKAEDSLPF